MRRNITAKIYNTHKFRISYIFRYTAEFVHNKEDYTFKGIINL